MFSLNLTTNNKIMATAPILTNPTVEDIHKANVHSFNNNSMVQCLTYQPDKCNYLFSPSFHKNKDITC